MRIVLELKRGEMAIPILNKLYKHTQLQTTFGIILLTIVNNQPKTLNLKSLIAEFVNFRKEIITKRSIFELNKALERLHILEGLKIALDNIDEVIAMIKKAQNTQEAKTSLMDRFNLSEKQATSILEMRLQRLTSLERTKIVNEYNATEVEIKRLQQILADEKLLLNIIKQELTEINNKYGDERLTEIVDWLPEITTEDMIKEEEVVVTITYKGYIKRTPVDQYKHQARGGKGKIGIIVKEEDFVDHLYVASTHSYIIFFTNTGKAHIVKVFNITEAQMSSRGKPIVNLINIDKNERITAVTHVKEFSENRFLFLATKKGQVKKVTLDSLKHLRSPGIRVISLPEDDGLISVLETNGQNELMIATKKGMSIRFKETDVRPMGRVAYGIRGIKLKKDDEVVSIEVVSQDCNVFTVTEKAYGKCAPCSEYRLQTRGGSGIINVRCREKNGEVVSLKELSEKDEVILVTDTGRTIRFKTMNIPIQKRGGLGVKLMDLNEDKKIHGVAVIEEE
jgi:DNA gyrase subunit A